MPQRHGETTGGDFRQGGEDLAPGSTDQPPREAAARTGPATGHGLDDAAAGIGCMSPDFSAKSYLAEAIYLDSAEAPVR